MAGAHKSVSIFYGVFEVVSLKILQKNIKDIMHHYLLHAIGKELWKNC